MYLTWSMANILLICLRACNFNSSFIFSKVMANTKVYYYTVPVVVGVLPGEAYMAV